MIIHLKKNEKLFLNGAVIKLDRRGSIELLNDAQFLLASHVLQVEEATTPLRRLYFVVQTMLIDPGNSELTRAMFTTHMKQLRTAVQRPDYQSLLAAVDGLIEEGKYFEALKLLRKSFDFDNGLVPLIHPPQRTETTLHANKVALYDHKSVAANAGIAV